MDFSRWHWQKWPIWAVASSFVGGIIVVANAQQAVTQLYPAFPASHAYVDASVNAVQQNTQAMFRSLSADVARVRIDQLRTGIAQLQSQKIQLTDLQAKDPNNQFIASWITQIDSDSNTDMLALKAATCDLTRSIAGPTAC